VQLKCNTALVGMVHTQFLCLRVTISETSKGLWEWGSQPVMLLGGFPSVTCVVRLLVWNGSWWNCQWCSIPIQSTI